MFEEKSNLTPKGRLAPSPTGLLHLGNAWSFLLAWLSIRSQNGSIVLRHEDIDPDRSKSFWMDQIEEDLHWLGLDWDGQAYKQSNRFELYQSAVEFLLEKHLIYPCYCTRKELRILAGAPHGATDGLGDAGASYPGICRNLSLAERLEKERLGKRSCLRLLCPDNELGLQKFTDLVLGNQYITITQVGGDFAVRRSDGVWAYQLAVSVDDNDMGITEVIRGNDILYSTPRQIYLLKLLNSHIPTYGHIPLLCDSNGERLAKRHSSISLQCLKKIGIPSDNIIGWLAYQAGITEHIKPILPYQLSDVVKRRGGIDWHFLSKQKIIVPDNIQKILKNIN